MISLVNWIRTTLDPQIQAAGVCDDIYYGFFFDADHVLQTHAAYLLIDDEGEDVLDDPTLDSHLKGFKVGYELGVKMYDTQDGLTELLTRWRNLERVVFDVPNRQIFDPGAISPDPFIISEELHAFPSVTPGTIFGEGMPAWRFRHSTVVYRRLVCHGGFK